MTWCRPLRQASAKDRPCRWRIRDLCRPLAGASAYGKVIASGGVC